ncbi:SapB/AmfS family lanthipeptide [Planomonospora algeriensis]
MVLLDLQSLEAPTGGGSSLTVLTCNSGKPSNLSVALCH